MKQRLHLLGEFLYFIFIATPVFLLTITAVYVGFFMLDAYKLIKKIWKKFSKH